MIETILLLICLGVTFSVVLWFMDLLKKRRLYDELKPRLDSLERNERELSNKKAEAKQQFATRIEKLAKIERAFEKKRAEREQAIERELAERKQAIERELAERKQVMERELAEHKQAMEEELAERASELGERIANAQEETRRTEAVAKQQLNARAKEIDEREQSIIILSQQKAIGFPWLAKAYADFFHLEELKLANALEIKSHPAYTAAEKVREAASRRREAERIARILKYQIEFYESLFPWLEDLKSEEIEEELIRIRIGEDDETNEDPAKKWLAPEEYNQLPAEEKYQLALDRYWKKKKSKWELGRDYERYIGYLNETKGASVHYQGIIEGFNDLGRDLIVTTAEQTQIVQCKYWSKEKTIHEKHIFQLYGTLTAFKIDNPDKDVRGHFVTSTMLSERARQFAGHLGIKITESLPLQQYPCIKCNISRRDGERIYHLPFDQQYDKTVIEQNKGEFYASTVAEAEDRGFRRAFKYRGNNN